MSSASKNLRQAKKEDGRKNNRPPPEKTWKPGQSGNPSGRTKGSKSTGTLVTEILDQIVAPTIGGKPMKMSLRKAMLMKLVEDFMQRSNQKSLAFLLQLYDAANVSKRSPGATSAEDQEVLEALFKMLKTQNSGDGDG